MRKKPRVLRSLLMALVLSIIIFIGWDYNLFRDSKTPSFAIKMENENVDIYMGLGYTVNDYHNPQNGGEPYMTWNWFWE